MKNTINSKRFYLIMLMYIFSFVFPIVSYGAQLVDICRVATDFVVHDTWVYVDHNGKSGKIKYDKNLGAKTDNTKETWL